MSSIVETSRPSVETVTLTDAKSFARVSTTADDNLLTNIIIPGARRQLESLLGLTLANRTFTEYYDGFPFFPYFSSPYAALFGAAFPFYFGYGPIASYPYPAIGGLKNELLSPFTRKLQRSPVTAVDHIDFIGTDGKNHGLLPGKDFVVDFASQPGRIAPIPGQRWPVGMTGINTVAIFYTAGYQPPGTETVSILDGADWQALSLVPQNTYILDPNGNVELQIAANGKTGETEPTWPAVGATVTDGFQPNQAVWKNLGPIIGRWTANTVFNAPAVVLDANGYLESLIISTLTSGGTEPTWSETLGNVNSDNGHAAWMNIGVSEQEGASDPPNQLTQITYDIAIPENLYMALLQLTVHWYQNRDVIIAGGPHVPLPLQLQSIIDAERIMDFGPIEP